MQTLDSDGSIREYQRQHQRRDVLTAIALGVGTVLGLGAVIELTPTHHNPERGRTCESKS